MQQSPVPQRRPVLKIILLGDSGVGKTSLMRQFVSGKFENRYKATIGADFFSVDDTIDGIPVKLQVWDTAGAERFASLGSAFYRGADACMLVYDITSSESYSHMSVWASEFTLQAGRKEMVLVGNKCDLEDKRQVFQRMVSQWCKDNPSQTSPSEPMPFFETSAKENKAVADAFRHVAAAALRAKSAGMELFVAPSVKLAEPKKRDAKKKDDRCSC